MKAADPEGNMRGPGPTGGSDHRREKGERRDTTERGWEASSRVTDRAIGQSQSRTQRQRRGCDQSEARINPRTHSRSVGGEQ